LKTFGILIPNKPFFRTLLVFSFFVFTAGFVPAVGAIFLIFLPLLTFFYSTVAGTVKTAAAFFIPALATFLFSHLLHVNAPYLLIIIMGVVGLTISATALRNSNIEKTVGYPSLIIIGAICTFFLYSGWELSIPPWKLVQQFVDKAIEQNINFYTQIPLNKEDIDWMKNNRLMLAGFLADIFPALAVIGSIIIVWINVLLGRNYLRGTAINLPRLNELSRWSAPEFIIWIFIVSGGLLLFGNEQIRFFSLNLFILACFLYLLQGLAILSFIFQNKNVPNFFRFLFYFLIAVQQFLMIPVIVVGLFDIWVDFRKFFQNNQVAT
jgi:uncharacterized protein YybS (DUF2232 family)